MRHRTTSIALALALATTSLGGCAKQRPTPPEEVEAEWATPEIEDVGKVAEIPEAAPVRNRPGPRRVVVEITSTPVNHSEANPGLVAIARLLNLYASQGVEPEQLDVVALLTGDATTAALETEAYQGLHDVVVDPNGDVIEKLIERGVEILVDAQALAHRKLDPKRVHGDVTVTPSSEIALVEHQLDGYALLRK